MAATNTEVPAEWTFSVDSGSSQLPQMISQVSISSRNSVHMLIVIIQHLMKKFRSHSFIKTLPYNSYPGRPK